MDKNTRNSGRTFTGVYMKVKECGRGGGGGVKGEKKR